MKYKLLILTLFLIVFSNNVRSQNNKFEASVESLKQYKCPEWFRDAKFGIWVHWGPQCVPMRGDWYARNMYIQGHKDYDYHVKHYGHPSKFGYKDIIELFKPDKLDFDSLMKLYKQAGAKYAVILAVHHDNFDLWNSKYHEWNSVNKGPKRDLVGEFRDAALKYGLRFGVSEHNARSYSWFQPNKGTDKEGKQKGVPYDGNDPRFQSLYHPPSEDDSYATPGNPPLAWREQWLARTKDLIDNYKPDHMYFDGGIPFYGEDDSKTGKELIAHYYNQNMKWHNGKQEGVMCTKKIENHGLFIEGATTRDIEWSTAPEIMDEPWQKDMTLGGWFYYSGANYGSAGEKVLQLIDIVSKNGNLLLNIQLKPDGSLDDEAVTFLKDFGEWMRINGEALYGTRPWLVFGEGTTNYKGEKHENLNIKYKPGELRFTARGDSELSAFIMAWPESNRVIIRSLAKTNGTKGVVKKVEMYGQAGKCKFRQTSEGLEVELPLEKPCQYAWTLKITGENLKDFQLD